jgi:hypothetical protein
MGCVYLAMDHSLSRRVAIKVISHSDPSDTNFIDRLAHEAKVIANLSHPNVVHVHAFDIVDGVPVVEMEYIAGGSLAQRFRDQFVLTSESVRFAHGVARALAYSHDFGAIHRDVKPSNILIDQHGQARLADFGIAKVIAESEMMALTNSRSSVFQGTPYYAPPEAWDGEEPSETWDLYSLGAVMYEAVTGAPPHVASTPLELAMKMATERVQPVRKQNSKVSPELGALVDELLTREASERPNDAADVAHRIECLPEYSREAGVGGETTIVGLRVPKRRNRKAKAKSSPRLARLISTLGVAAVLAVVAGLWWQYANQRIWLDEFSKRMGGESILAVSAPMQDLYALFPSERIETLLDTRNSALDQIVLSPRGPGVEDGMLWLTTLDDDSVPTSVTSFGAGVLSQMELVPAERGYAVTGNWAEYSDSGGTVFRHGSVTGMLDWQPAAKALVGNLGWIDQLDGSIREMGVSAIPAPEVRTRTRFGYLIEASEVLTPLLYLEMIPRQLEWAASIDRLTPVYGGGRAVVEIESGALSEINYNRLRRMLEGGEPKPTDCIVGIPVDRTPVIRTAVVDDGLQLDLLVTVADADLPLRVEAALVKDFLVPLSASPTLNVTHFLEDGTTLETYDSLMPESADARCGVTAEIVDDVLTARFTIPFTAFVLNPEAPGSDDTMRLAAAVVSEAETAKDQVIAHWGFPEDGVSKHGAIIRFID